MNFYEIDTGADVAPRIRNTAQEALDDANLAGDSGFRHMVRVTFVDIPNDKGNFSRALRGVPSIEMPGRVVLKRYRLHDRRKELVELKAGEE